MLENCEVDYAANKSLTHDSQTPTEHHMSLCDRQWVGCPILMRFDEYAVVALNSELA